MLVLLFAGAMRVLPPCGLHAVPPGSGSATCATWPAGPDAGSGEARVHPADHGEAMLDCSESRSSCSCARKGTRRTHHRVRHALRNAAVPDRDRRRHPVRRAARRSDGHRDAVRLARVGSLVVTAINLRNYPVVQGGVLVIATLFILVNWQTDLHVRGARSRAPRRGELVNVCRRCVVRRGLRPRGSWGRVSAWPSGRFLVLIAMLAPVLAPHDPDAIDSQARVSRPQRGSGVPFGSDALGRDVLEPGHVRPARVAGGGRRLGLDFAGGRRAPRAWWPATSAAGSTPCLMRPIDVLLAFPALLLAIAIVAIVGPGGGGRADGHRGDLSCRSCRGWCAARCSWCARQQGYVAGGAGPGRLGPADHVRSRAAQLGRAGARPGERVDRVRDTDPGRAVVSRPGRQPPTAELG